MVHRDEDLKEIMEAIVALVETQKRRRAKAARDNLLKSIFDTDFLCAECHNKLIKVHVLRGESNGS